MLAMALTSERYSSVDLMRGYAVAVMVIVHFLENLSGTREWSPDGFGAPIFVFLTGVSYRLWLGSRERRGVAADQISRETIRRGLFLVGLGFLFNAFVWLPEDLFTWDVLTFIGVAMCLLNVVRSMPVPAVMVMIVLSVVVSPVMQRLADYPAYWINGYFDAELTLPELLTGFLVTGYFPLFPWLALPLTGFVAAPALLGIGRVPKGRRSRWEWSAAALILLVLVLTVLRHMQPGNVAWLPAWTMFPASLSYLAGVTGMVILLLSGLHRWVDDGRATWLPESLLEQARLFSKYSLTMYLLHHIIHLWPIWICGYWYSGEPTVYWGRVLPWWPSFLLGVLLLIWFAWFLRWLERNRVRTVENLMRWLAE